MTYSKIKIAQALLCIALFQLVASSCTYQQLPALRSTVTYGSRLVPKEMDETHYIHPLPADPYHDEGEAFLIENNEL